MRSFALLLGSTVLAGCSLQSANEGARLSLVLPNPRTFSQSNLSSVVVAGGGGAPAAWNDPGFVCYGVNVTGPGIADSGRRPTPNPNVSGLVAGTTACAYRGVVSNGFTFAAGQSEAAIDLQVPPGVSRVIQLVGITNAAYCASNFLESDLVGSPGAYEIGRTVVDLFGDATVNIGVNYVASESKRVDCGGAAATVSSVTIATPAAGAYVNSANQSGFVVAGACSFSGQNVDVKANGVAVASFPCAAGAWTGTLDLSNGSAYPEGSNVTLSVEHAPAGGATPLTDSRTVGKDTIAPSAPSVTFAESAYALANPTGVNVVAPGASEMYLTNSSACAGGGTWAPFATPTTWTLPNVDAANTLYAKFRDVAGNESSCVSASITHDAAAPAGATGLGWSQTSPQLSFAVTPAWTKSTSTDVFGQSIQFYTDATCTTATGSSIGGLTSGQQTYAWTAPGEGTFYYKVTTTDYAGRPSASACSAAMTIDATAPTAATGLLWGAGAPYSTNQTIVANWTKSVSADATAQTLMVYSDGTCTNLINSVPLAAATQTYSYPSGADGIYAFRIQSADGAGNLAATACSPAVTVDSVAPTVAIGSPAANSFINNATKSAFAVSGTCSENGGGVVISGAASAIPTCTAGAWSASLDFSAAADGNVTIDVNLSDAAGNAAAQASRTFVKDTVAGLGGVTSPNGVLIQTGDVFPVVIAANDANPGSTPYLIEYSWDTGNNWVQLSNAVAYGAPNVTFNWTASQTPSAPNAGRIKVTFTDAAGNTQFAMSNGFTLVGPPTKLAFVPNAMTPATLNSGACYGPLPIEVRDAFDSLSRATANVTVALGTGGMADFYTASDCDDATLVTSKTIVAGTSSTSVYYSSPSVGAMSFTASASGLTAANRSLTGVTEGSWAMGTSLSGGRSAHSTVWTGTQMIVWGGGPSGSASNTGKATNGIAGPTTLTTAGAPGLRSKHTAVWTGSKMVVWGGYNAGALNTGGQFDGTSWTGGVTTTSAPTARYDHSAVWTGSEMIVWGGTNGSAYYNTGSRYNPGADVWSAALPIAPIGGRSEHVAAVGGSQVIVWGGRNAAQAFGDGAVFDGANWTTMSTAGAPSPRRGAMAVWSTSTQELLVWGGQDFSGTTTFNDGAAYDPVANTWRPIEPLGAPLGRFDAGAIWTGVEMVIYGGDTMIGSLLFGGAYNPSTNTWKSIDAQGGFAAAIRPSMVWTGTEALFYGGDFNSNYNVMRLSGF